MAEHDPLDFDGNELRHEAAKERQRLHARQQDEDLKFVLSSESGRRFMADLLFNRCGLMNRISFTGDDRTNFNEGMRNIGVNYFADIQRVCPGRFVQILKEQGDT